MATFPTNTPEKTGLWGACPTWESCLNEVIASTCDPETPPVDPPDPPDPEETFGASGTRNCFDHVYKIGRAAGAWWKMGFVDYTYAGAMVYFDEDIDACTLSQTGWNITIDGYPPVSLDWYNIAPRSAAFVFVLPVDFPGYGTSGANTVCTEGVGNYSNAVSPILNADHTKKLENFDIGDGSGFFVFGGCCF